MDRRLFRWADYSRLLFILIFDQQMQKMNLNTFITFLFISLSLSHAEETVLTIEHSGWKNREILIEGFEGMRSYTLTSFTMTDTLHSINLSYRGFALLKSGEKEIYPLILDTLSVSMAYDGANQEFRFEYDAANRQLYRWLQRDGRLKNVNHLLTHSRSTLPPNDPFQSVLEKEHHRIHKRREELKSDLPANPLANLVIKSRLLISAMEENMSPEHAMAWKKRIAAFISENQEQIWHTDILQRFAYNWFMLLEIATPENYNWRESVISDMQRWASFFKDVDAKNASSQYIIKFYLDRSMISMAAGLSSVNIDLFACNDGFNHSNRGTILPNIPCFYSDKRRSLSLDQVIHNNRLILVLADLSCASARAMLHQTGRYLGQHPDKGFLIFASSDGKSAEWAGSLDAFHYNAVLDDVPARQVIWPGREQLHGGIVFLVGRNLQVENIFYSYRDLINYLERG